ncbi:MAG: hypothetical protein E7370_03855 [Clostridiales bacterium]|nr:hypothetical protein [Clostridiales bacterium]
MWLLKNIWGYCIALLLVVLAISYKPLLANAITVGDNEVVGLESVSVSSNYEQDILNIAVQGTQDLTDIVYIENANYFLVNPKHAINNVLDNPSGTCSTVAMQLLLGYHNYYSDRRLIPAQGENGRVFLSDNYGDINEHPIIDNSFAIGQGRASIGAVKSQLNN